MYIARQPILNRNQEVYGYELLYRDQRTSAIYDGGWDFRDTAKVVDGLFAAGLDRIVEDNWAFLNVDRAFLASPWIYHVNPHRAVLEILEDVQIDEGFLALMAHLKGKGYRFALDDFLWDYDTYPLVPYVDIIKFDFLNDSPQRLVANASKALQDRKILLAEKVESQAVFESALAMDFDLFQGFFFSKPRIVAHTKKSTSIKLHYLKLIKALNNSDGSFNRLSELIQLDGAMATQLMKAASVESPKANLASIRQALKLLGSERIEIYLHQRMLMELAQHKPPALISMALVRSRFAESINSINAPANRGLDAAMMGLYSVLDGILDLPFEVAFEDVLVSSSVKAALIHRQGILAPLYRLVLAYEQGDLGIVQEESKRMNLPVLELSQYYLSAILWSKERLTTFGNNA